MGEKLREVDGIKLYPTHAWTDDMQPIVDADKKLEDTPVIIGVAADSGCGKSTFMRRLTSIFGGDVVGPLGGGFGSPDGWETNTLISDLTTVICLDDYHLNDRN